MTRGKAATWKIYGPSGAYEGEAVYGELAAAMVSVLGDEATVRTAGGQVVWREGAEERSAAESYDTAALKMHARGYSGESAPDMPPAHPRDGIDFCHCGAKYWGRNHHCLSCGERFRR